MTQPLTPGFEPGESEYSHGKGILPPLGRGYVPSDRVRLGMRYQTDAANPEADEEGTLVVNPTQTHLDEANGVIVMGDLDQYATPRVRETGPSKPAGIDPSKYNVGHYADGLQDGAGEAWRESLPPNLVG